MFTRLSGPSGDRWKGGETRSELYCDLSPFVAVLFCHKGRSCTNKRFPVRPVTVVRVLKPTFDIPFLSLSSFLYL